MSLDQYAFRFYNDDGGEATSTPYAAQNANITWPLDTNIRLRIGVSHFGDAAPATSKYMLFAAPSGTNKWFEVAPTGTGKIRLARSGGSPNNIPAGGVATTQRLTAPGYSPTPVFTAGRAWDDESGQDDVAIGNNQFTEMEWCLQAVSANGAQNADVYDFRVARVPGSGAPLARITGGVEVAVNANAASGSTSVAVPATATYVVAFWNHYDAGAGDTLATLTLNGVSMLPAVVELNDGQLGADQAGCGIADLAAPATGSQTLAWAWGAGGARTAGGGIYLVFFEGTVPGGVVRDADATTSNGSTEAQLTLTSELSDIVIAMAFNDVGTVAVTGASAVLVDENTQTGHTTDIAVVPAGSGSPLASGFTLIDMTGENWGGLAAIALRTT